MKYPINLFGYNIDCELIVENQKLLIEIPDESQVSLRQYLKRVLPKYDKTTDGMDLQELIKTSIDVEKTLDLRMSEPKIKLPYEFQPDIKEKLIEAAALQDMSATQLLIRIIENKHKEIIGLEES